ncbi:hypothetical protein BH10PSE7_BH10PSE7_26910 [soil metagenome]
MRKGSVLALAFVTLALAACKGGGEAPGLGLCGLNCPPDTDDGGDDTTGGGDDTTPGTDTTPGGGDDSGGNETSLSSGDTTVALESGKLVSPSGGSLSRLTIKTNPNKGLIEVDTKTESNNTWLVPQEMDEHTAGSEAQNIFSPANLGAQSYKEYRTISASGIGRDEELQVWNFDNSYATQYRNVSNGTALQQAFSFGGDRTALAEMPTSATATYTGRFGSTAVASNWVNPEAQNENDVVINRNNKYVTNGSAKISTDFGAQTVNGTLRTEHVRFHDGKQFLIYDTATDKLMYPNGTIYRKQLTDGTYVDANPLEPGFYRTPIFLNGTITGNTYAGKAKLGNGFINGDNPMYGGFFGPNAGETTGAFSVKGVAVDPIGGEYPIDDDRRGYLQHTGIFHAKHD